MTKSERIKDLEGKIKTNLQVINHKLLTQRVYDNEFFDEIRPFMETMIRQNDQLETLKQFN